jgi:hypothetical protein
MANEPKPKLFELLNKVHDDKSFLSFVQALVEDRTDEVEKEKKQPSSPFGRGANGWENGTIEAFLGAATAWATSMDFGRNRKNGTFNENSWNQFAHFLYAGKIYE